MRRKADTCNCTRRKGEPFVIDWCVFKGAFTMAEWMNTLTLPLALNLHSSHSSSQVKDKLVCEPTARWFAAHPTSCHPLSIHFIPILTLQQNPYSPTPSNPSSLLNPLSSVSNSLSLSHSLLVTSPLKLPLYVSPFVCQLHLPPLTSQLCESILC